MLGPPTCIHKCHIQWYIFVTSCTIFFRFDLDCKFLDLLLYNGKRSGLFVVRIPASRVLGSNSDCWISLLWEHTQGIGISNHMPQVDSSNRCRQFLRNEYTCSCGMQRLHHAQLGYITQQVGNHTRGSNYMKYQVMLCTVHVLILCVLYNLGYCIKVQCADDSVHSGNFG